MNLLEAMYACLGVGIFVIGVIVNYGKTIIPESVAQLFRYGRANISSMKPGFIKQVEVPKRWFAHFYLHAVILQLVVLVSVIQLYRGGGEQTWLFSVLKLTGDRQLTVNQTTTVVATSLFFFHLCRRLYETLFVSVYSNTTKMNVAHYLLGYIHYTGAVFCVIAHSPGIAFSNSASVNTDASALESVIGLKEIFGITGFFIGNYLQHRAHVGLANLRKGKDKKAMQSHSIPRGEMFEYISCPNYFAEIVIYCAFAGLFGFKNSSWNYCTIWVISNQVTAGIMNHLWYHEVFKDYPKNRKAIIPYIW